MSQPAFSAELEARDRERVLLQLSLLEAARSRLPSDPFPHYLAHCRIRSQGDVVDVLLVAGGRSRRTRTLASGIVIADFAESGHAELFFAGREGKRHATGSVHGTLLERSVVGFAARGLVDVVTSDAWLTCRTDGVWRRQPGLPSGVFEQRPAAARRKPPSLIDVDLDPAQRAVVELPAGRSVLVLGEAGHGKTTVALHRLARLARSAGDGVRVAVLVPSVGLERLLHPLLHSLGLRVEVRTFERWALEQTRRAFPGLGRRVSQSASASIIRFKRDPALRLALSAIAGRRLGRIDDQREKRGGRATARVGRGDLQHLFGDRALIDQVLKASRDPIGAHGVTELLEHTRIQFSTPAETEYAHVDSARLRTVDGRRIDDGTPLEDAGSIDAEDCAVLFEIDRLRAERRKQMPTEPERYDCIVIDEAQEFAPIELSLIGRSLAAGGTLIVAGDADQQTDPAAFFAGWAESMRMLGVETYERVMLGVNYRCPPKVVQVAKRLVSSSVGGHADQADPGPTDSLQRRLPDGAKPEALAAAAARVRFLNEAHLGLWLIEELRRIAHGDRRASVAVICRGPATAQRLTRLLRHALDARLVLDGAFAYESGVNVTTVDQVKGLEFDYVIVPDASKTSYPDQPSSRRALYVAVTRSRHELAIGSVTERTRLLPD